MRSSMKALSFANSFVLMATYHLTMSHHGKRVCMSLYPRLRDRRGDDELLQQCVERC